MSPLISSGEKHALLIGINRYPNLLDTQQLKGCVNDALQLRSVLVERFGFSPDGIDLLSDEKATRDSILAALQDLARKVGPGDVVVVGYSGHGSRGRTEEKSTGSFETIVPYDSGRGSHPNRDVLDDEIHEWLLAMAAITPNLTLVFDSCFSAGITRDPFEDGIRQIPSGVLRSSRGDQGSRDAIRETSGWRALGGRYTLIASCRSDEVSREIQIDQGGGQPLHHGALTYFLCEEIRRAGRDASSRDIFERAAAKVTASFSTQHPLLEGARDREPFGPRIFDTMGFLPIRSRLGNQAVLAGGAAHGLTVGSEWDVYPQGTHEVTPEAPRLGRLKVRSVQAVTADVDIEEDELVSPRPLEPGDRAVEANHDYGEMRLVVEICGPLAAIEALDALTSRIRETLLLRPAAPHEKGHVRVYLVLPRTEARDGDPAPLLGAIRAPLWAVIGVDGNLLAPPLFAENEGALTRLIEALEIRARLQLTLRVENPARDSGLRDRIEVNLLRWKNRKWIPAEPEDGGLVRFRNHEPFDLQILNHTRRPVYIHVLDLGLSGRIELLYPVAGALDQLLPERPLLLSEKRGTDFQFYIPEILPFEKPGESVEGLQHLKVLATIDTTDFSLLVQDGVKYLASPPRTRPFKPPLEHLLTAAMTGKTECGTRETSPVSTSLVDDWTSVTRSVLIQR
jgi:Caspase domain